MNPLPTITPFPQTLRNRDLPRRRDYAANLAWYEGKQWSGQPRKGERRMVLNYAARVVNRSAGLLLKNRSIAIAAPVAQPQEAATPAAEAWARAAADSNLEVLDLETEIDCAVLGDACYKVTWDAKRDRLRITSPDVQGLHAWWEPDDPNQVIQVAHQYRVPAGWGDSLPPRGGEGERGGPGRGGSPRDVTITERWTQDQFDLWIDDRLTTSAPNPYPWIPYVLLHNERRPKAFWGTSDLEAFRDTQEELNRELSTLSRVMELSGTPIAVLENVEKGEDIAIGPGAVWTLPAGARAYLLDLLSRGGVRLHLEYLTAVYRTLHDLAETPRSAFGDIGRTLSGVAMELDLLPLLHKVARKRLARSGAYAQRTRMALDLLMAHEQLASNDYQVQVHWGDVLPRDENQDAGREIDLVQAGLSRRTSAMRRLHVDDPEEEFAGVLDEQQRYIAASAPPMPVLPDVGAPVA